MQKKTILEVLGGHWDDMHEAREAYGDIGDFFTNGHLPPNVHEKRMADLHEMGLDEEAIMLNQAIVQLRGAMTMYDLVFGTARFMALRAVQEKAPE